MARPLFTHLQGRHLCVKSKPCVVLRRALAAGQAELTELLESGTWKAECLPFHLLQASRHADVTG